MQISATPTFSSRPQFTNTAPAGPQIQLAPGDAYVPSSVTPVHAAASGAVLGGAAGLIAGATSGFAGGLAGGLAGAGGGILGGALLGGIAARLVSNNEWDTLRYAQYTAPAGGVAGAIGGALLGAGQNGLASTIGLAVAGAVGGAALLYVLAESAQ